MRAREAIEQDHRGYELLTLEVLLDIRQLLKDIKGRREKVKRPLPAAPKKRPGRPKKVS